jgi:anti-sigma factor (TIGR02949 family)
MNFDCEETFRRLQDYLDRELSPEEVDLVHAHLATCGMCAEEYVFEASLLRRVSQCVQDTEIPENLFAMVSASLDRVT